MGVRALSEGNELPPRRRAGTGARGMRAGFGPHGIAVTETILAYDGRQHLSGWQVGANHVIKAIGLSFSSDVVIALPTATCEVRLFEADNGTMARARLAKRGWDYERYAGHRVWEGARGTVGRSYDFWARHRYTRSRLFPALHVVLTGLARTPPPGPPGGSRPRRRGHHHRGAGHHVAAPEARRAVVRARRR
ncbi:replication-relaxation family protein [Streptomyces rimosus]|uniref:replication-relaxation family protein n=1 Tax=Streptomyces rimosus TaxID=1927 RepID=UPI001F30B91F|nr:replication-relaxation family protein [Streptomyces rimosus]